MRAHVIVGQSEILFDSDAQSGFTVATLDGWLGHPDTKVDLVERSEGDGAFDIQDSDVTYSARTVTITWRALGVNRDDVVSMLDRLRSFGGRLATLRVEDSTDTFAVGYVRLSTDSSVDNAATQTGTFTVVCPDPRRYSWDEQQFFLHPNAAGPGGLSFGPDNKGLVYPLNYGPQATDARNVCSMTNGGSAPAFPRFEVHGSFSSLILETSLGTIRYSQPVGVEPLVLDCLTRTASVGGLDRSQFLTERGFPQIPPGGSVSVSLQSSGTGWIVASVRDTFI